MPETVREYLHAFCMLLTVGAGIVGIVMLRAAFTVSQHLGAVVVLAIAAAALFVAYKLKPKETAGELQSMGKRHGDHPGPDKERAI